ncbi:hypothetical protein Dda_1317 [Drechslerella dactyloides]|uniref:Uncharacterized protein n=1 Tax=Drechslerella dactyloides TaxID=74499 RepID=A0AAD6J1S8_DREDA|nr:hypothetical protein Dda_1317 [Drechslerella dactyloides]
MLATLCSERRAEERLAAAAGGFEANVGLEPAQTAAKGGLLLPPSSPPSPHHFRHHQHQAPASLHRRLSNRQPVVVGALSPLVLPLSSPSLSLAPPSAGIQVHHLAVDRRRQSAKFPAPPPSSPEPLSDLLGIVVTPTPAEEIPRRQPKPSFILGSPAFRYSRLPAQTACR